MHIQNLRLERSNSKKTHNLILSPSKGRTQASTQRTKITQFPQFSTDCSPIKNISSRINKTQSISSTIDNIRDFHRELINDMEINHKKPEQQEEVRVMKLILETLWMHLLDKSFSFDFATQDVNLVLQSIKELRSDWVMMVRSYEGFQKKIARRLFQKQDCIDQQILLTKLQQLLVEKSQQDERLQQLYKQVKCTTHENNSNKRNIFSNTSKPLSKNFDYCSKTSMKKSKPQIPSKPTQFNLDQCCSFLQAPVKQSFVYVPELQNSHKYIQQLVGISEQLGDQLQSKQQILHQCLQVMARVKGMIQVLDQKGSEEYHDELNQIKFQIQRLQIQNQKLQKSTDSILKKIEKAQELNIQNNTNNAPNYEILSQSTLINSPKFQMKQFNKQNQKGDPTIKISEYENQKDQNQFQQMNQKLQQLKAQNSQLSYNLKNKQILIEQLENKNTSMLEQIQIYKNKKEGLFKQLCKTKKTKDSETKENKIKNISELMDKDHQQDLQYQKPEDLPGFDRGKLRSLLECFFPEEENQLTTIREMQKLRKQIQSYNQSPFYSNSDLIQSPLQLVVLAVQNLIQHLCTLGELQRTNILESLREHIYSITEDNDYQPSKQIGPQEFQRRVKIVISKAYNDMQTPIRRQIQQFTTYFYNKKPEHLLYLVEQFTKRVARLQFGQSRRSSIDSRTQRMSHRLSRSVAQNEIIQVEAENICEEDNSDGQ